VSLAAIRFASVAIDAANEIEISGSKIAPRRVAASRAFPLFSILLQNYGDFYASIF